MFFSRTHINRRVAHAAFVAFGATVLTASIVVRADQGPPAPAAGARPLVPMTASTIARDPAAHIGENVSMMATVEAVLSKTVFVVDQDKSKTTGQDVLVIAPTLIGALSPNTYVTVQGEVITFDPAEIAKKARTYTVDLPQELIAKYQGKPAVLATAVVTPALIDLAKRPIPPMTPAEVAFSGHMKIVNSAFPAIRGGLENPDAAQLKEQAAALKKAFTDVEAFFKSRGTADALKWAGEALKHATTIEAGIAAAKWDDVRAAAGSLQPMCAQCHGQFRERMDDGTYRFKNIG